MDSRRSSEYKYPYLDPFPISRIPLLKKYYQTAAKPFKGIKIPDRTVRTPFIFSRPTMVQNQIIEEDSTISDAPMNEFAASETERENENEAQAEQIDMNANNNNLPLSEPEPPSTNLVCNLEPDGEYFNLIDIDRWPIPEEVMKREGIDSIDLKYELLHHVPGYPYPISSKHNMIILATGTPLRRQVGLGIVVKYVCLYGLGFIWSFITFVWPMMMCHEKDRSLKRN